MLGWDETTPKQIELVLVFSFYPADSEIYPLTVKAQDNI